MKSIVVFVMLVLGVLSFGQTSPVKFNKTVADFGEVTHGNTVLTTFSFVNTSDSSIKIKEVLPQCGCTSVDFTKDAVLPDAKG